MLGTILVVIVLVGVVALIIRSMVRDKKNGKSVICGGECSHCGHTCPHRMANEHRVKNEI